MVAPNLPIATSCRFRHLGDGTHWAENKGRGVRSKPETSLLHPPTLKPKFKGWSLSRSARFAAGPHHKCYTLPSRTQRMSNASTKSPQAEPHHGGSGRKLSDTIPMEAVQRIAKLPVVESSLNIATDMYSRVKVRY